MPEGPEVRRHADALALALVGKPISLLTARTKTAKTWLAEHPDELVGRKVERVWSRGKNLFGQIEGGSYFYSHLMMWGRWHVFSDDLPLEVDRRERARIAAPGVVAILFSAPVFELGAGDPSQSSEYLRALGPDILPYVGEGPFNAPCFVERLAAHPSRTIGAALLDQQIAAGIGNYLRAEILFQCRLNPWCLSRDLSPQNLFDLCRIIPDAARSAYERPGVTVPADVQERMRQDERLVYRPGSEWGTHHWVFRRTNLPCLVCGDTICQKRQVTREDEDGEKERIIYFCPACQNVPVDAKKPRKRRVG